MGCYPLNFQGSVITKNYSNSPPQDAYAAGRWEMLLMDLCHLFSKGLPSIHSSSPPLAPLRPGLQQSVAGMAAIQQLPLTTPLPPGGLRGNPPNHKFDCNLPASLLHLFFCGGSPGSIGSA